MRLNSELYLIETAGMGKHRQAGRRGSKRGRRKVEEIDPETRADDIFEAEEVEAEEDVGAGRRFDVRFDACNVACLSVYG